MSSTGVVAYSTIDLSNPRNLYSINGIQKLAFENPSLLSRRSPRQTRPWIPTSLQTLRLPTLPSVTITKAFRPR